MHEWPGGGPPLAACGRVHRVPGLQVTIPHATLKMAAGYCVRRWNRVLESITMKHKNEVLHVSLLFHVNN